MNKKELQERVYILETELADEQQKVFNLNQEQYLAGIHLIDTPFIPEDLGFTEILDRDEDDVIQGRVYHKDGVNMSRPMNDSRWYIEHKRGEIGKYTIKNKLAGIYLLEALGLDFSVEKYNLESIERSIKNKEIAKQAMIGKENNELSTS